MKDGLIRIGGASPRLYIGDPKRNREELVSVAHAAAAAEVKVLLTPELSLTSASCGDLFRSPTLLRSAEAELDEYIRETAELDMISFVGLPLLRRGRIYNCMAAVNRGELMGFVAKQSVSPGHRGIFCSGRGLYDKFNHSEWYTKISDCFIYRCCQLPELTLALEIGEDSALPTPPSVGAVASGAAVILNPISRSEIIGLDRRRRLLAEATSARLSAGYLSVAAGEGESGTDGVSSGASFACECGHRVAARPPFSEEELFYTEFDLSAIMADRAPLPPEEQQLCEAFGFELEITETAISRRFNRHPFIPSPEELTERSELVLSIQSRGLAGRIARSYSKGSILGISGGLDSTLAILVAVRAANALGMPTESVTAVTMPGFGTSARTKSNARVLCEELGVGFKEISIAPAVQLHFKDIGHDESVRDVVYENSQARERTQILMDLANAEGKLVVGTGDLSELALGFATYNGDHMSMYGVNAGVPKTLLRSVVAYEADRYASDGRERVAKVLRDILDTPVSPELLPPDENGNIAQSTETILGPYEIHDFFLYHLVRRSASPRLILRLAVAAFEGKYGEEELRDKLKLFIRRFFSSQFKRSCLPDGPAVGSVSLSPRAAWRMPSDGLVAAWLRELD